MNMNTLYFVEDVHFLRAQNQGELPNYKNYTTPEYKGPSLYPKLGYHVYQGSIKKKIHEFTMKLLDQAAEVAKSAKTPIKAKYNKSTSNSSSPRASGTSDDLSINYEFVNLEKSWNYHRQAYAYAPEYEKRINKITELARGITQRNQSELERSIKQRNQSYNFASIHRFALPIIVSSGLLVAGALFANLSLVAIGALGLIGVGAYAVYKFSKISASDANVRDGDKIFKNIDKLQKTAMYDQAGDFFNQRMKYGTLTP